jgi:flagellar motor switch protein FliM
MAEAEVLNKAEIDALLNGVDSGAVQTEGATADSGTARAYDFNKEMRIVRGCLAPLELINERLARQLRVTLYNLLRRQVEVSVQPIQMKKFSEYSNALSLPTNINFIKVNPLRGSGLFVIEPKLVFAMVDAFFGGTGRIAKFEGREFAATEIRITQMFMHSAFGDIRDAWAPVTPIELEYLGSEVNPHFVNIVTPSEVVVISAFRIELESGGGELHITLPYSMIEPIRDASEAAVSTDHAENKERWTRALREEIEDAEVELATILGHGSARVSQLLDMKVGDVLPCDFAGQATVTIEGVPVFRGAFGVSRGQQCVRYDERVRRTRGNDSFSRKTF